MYSTSVEPSGFITLVNVIIRICKLVIGRIQNHLKLSIFITWIVMLNAPDKRSITPVASQIIAILTRCHKDVRTTCVGFIRQTLTTGQHGHERLNCWWDLSNTDLSVMTPYQHGVTLGISNFGQQFNVSKRRDWRQTFALVLSKSHQRIF